jgi:hypothetical protein
LFIFIFPSSSRRLHFDFVSIRISIKMRFTAASVLALAAGALAGSSSAVPSVVTEVVTSFETYCPEATTFVAGSSTVRVTTVCLLSP